MTTDPGAHDGFVRLQERTGRGDGEAAAALMILDERWARPKAEPFVDRDGIDFAAMLSAHDARDAEDGTCANANHDGGCSCGPYWSSGEVLMLRLAWNLWAGSNASAVNVSRLLDTCGDRMLRLALQAIKARSGGHLPMQGTSPAGSRRVTGSSRGSAWRAGTGIAPQQSPTPRRGP